MLSWLLGNLGRTVGSVLHWMSTVQPESKAQEPESTGTGSGPGTFRPQAATSVGLMASSFMEPSHNELVMDSLVFEAAQLPVRVRLFDAQTAEDGHMVVFEMVGVEPESRSSSPLSASAGSAGSSTSAGSSGSSLSVDVQLKTRPVGPGTRGGAGRGVCGVMFLTTSRAVIWARTGGPPDGSWRRPLSLRRWTRTPV